MEERGCTDGRGGGGVRNLEVVGWVVGSYVGGVMLMVKHCVAAMNLSRGRVVVGLDRRKGRD